MAAADLMRFRRFMVVDWECRQVNTGLSSKKVQCIDVGESWGVSNSVWGRWFVILGGSLVGHPPFTGSWAFFVDALGVPERRLMKAGV